IAVPAFASSNRYASGGGRADRFAGIAAQINPGMDRGAAKKRIHAHTERRTHVDFADNRLAHGHRDQCMSVTIDLRTGDIHAIKLTLEGAGTGLRRLDRNKWPTDRSVASRADRIDSEICEHAPHAARLRIDTFFKICEGR